MNGLLEMIPRVVDSWWLYVMHAGWQSAVVGLVLLAVVCWARRLSAPLRYAILVIALAKFLIPPMVAAPTGLFSQAAPLVVATDVEFRPSSPPVASPPGQLHPVDPVDARLEMWPEHLSDWPPLRDEPTTREEAAEAVAQPGERSESPERADARGPWMPVLNWKLALMLVHGLGVTGLLVLLGRQWLALRRLVDEAKEVAGGVLHQHMVELCGRLGIRRPICLKVSAGISSPIAFGTFYPTILIPTWARDRLLEDDVRVILAHELAHLRRGDAWMNWVQVLVCVLWWFHPVVWMVSGVMRRVREDCCDDLLLVSAVATRSGYCESLLRVASRACDRRPPPLVSAMTPRLHPLAARLRRIMDGSARRSVRLSLGGSMSIVLLAALLLPGIHLSAGTPGGEGDTTVAAPQDADFAESHDESFKQGELSASGSDGSYSAPANGEIADHVDLYGDPLPEGVTMRLGTVRYRSPTPVVRIAFSPADRMLTTLDLGERGEIVRFWDPATGRVLRTFMSDRNEGLHNEALSFSADGTFLAVAGWGGRRDGRLLERNYLQIWDVAAGVKRQVIEWEDDGRIRLIDFSPDGETIAIVLTRGVVRFWDVASGGELLSQRIVDGHVTSLAFSPDGSQLAVVGSLGAGATTVHLWDWREEGALRTLNVGGHRAFSVAYSPDGRSLAIATSGGAQVWDVDTGELRNDLLSEEDMAYVPDVAFSPDGKVLATLNRTAGTIVLWDPVDGHELRRLDDAPRARYVAISSDSKWLAAVSSIGNVLRVWNLNTGENMLAPWSGHHGNIGGVVFSPDGERLLTASDDGTVRLWDVAGRKHWRAARRSDNDADFVWEAASGKQLSLFEHEHGVRGLAVSPDGRWAASSSYDDTVRLWDLSRGEEAHRLAGHGPVGDRRGGLFRPDAPGIVDLEDHREVAFTPDSRRLVSAGDDLLLRVWDVAAGRALAEHQLEPDVEVQRPPPAHASDRVFPGIAFSQDGRVFAYHYGDKLFLFDAETGNEIRAWDVEKERYPNLAFSPDGRKLLSNDRRLRLRDTAMDEVVWSVPSPSLGGPVAFSSDGKVVAALSGRGHDQETVTLHETASGKKLGSVGPVSGYLMAIAFSPDGQLLATPDHDHSVLLWDIADLVSRKDQ